MSDHNGTPYDVCVVGGGIVGLATAYSLVTERPSLRICVVEQEDGWGRHQTGHNSGVIHSGLYYAPGSLKAKLTRAGLELMYDFCLQQGLPVERCGKVVVATDDLEVERLEALYERGLANGVEVRRIGAAELKAREPYVAGVAALHVADTGITDFGLVTTRLADLLGEHGVDLRLGTQVQRITTCDDHADLATSQGVVSARRVVAAAGLYSDRLVRLGGATPRASIVPFRGEYYHVRPTRRHLVSNLVYPVPDPGFPFLGVHLTRGIEGNVHVGPNAVLALSRNGYRWKDVSRETLHELRTSAGLRVLARRYWRTGSAEIARSLVKPMFVSAVQRLVPDIRARDLVRAESGVRAQALMPDGQLVDDFLFQEDGRCLHVINAPSPAATASLAIGREIAARALARLS